MINKAFSAIELAEDRVFHALLWFSNNTPSDTIFIDTLKAGENAKAQELLEKFTSNRAISARNVFNFNNISTLYFLENNFNKALSLKLSLIESEAWDNFVTGITDENTRVSSHKIIERVIDAFVSEIETCFDTSGYRNTKNSLTIQDGYARKYLVKKFSDEDLHYVEGLVDKTEKERKGRPEIAEKLAYKLHKECQEKLKKLKNILGEMDLQYQILSDQVAQEINQCSIDYYNSSERNVTKDCLPLLELAQQYATQASTRNKIQEDIETINAKIEEEKISGDLESIQFEIKRMTDNSHSTNSSLKKHAERCYYLLKNIKNVNKELYLNLSDLIVNIILSKSIEIVNKAQEKFSRDKDLGNLNSTLIHAVSLLNYLSSFDMGNDIRQRFITNKNVLDKLYSEVSTAYKSQVSETYKNTSSRRASNSVHSSSSDNDSEFGWVIWVLIALVIIAVMSNK
ncbi:hypothetical protein A4G20_04335 [Pasteurellaceae bacterium RH1A]|nr:hypothetical protein A4G20_04335 [Pasteurellaceae bacterium RH1A]